MDYEVRNLQKRFRVCKKNSRSLPVSYVYRFVVAKHFQTPEERYE